MIFRARFYRGTKFGLRLKFGCSESCWGVAFPKPYTSSQAPYPSPCRNRQDSLIPLLLLFSTKSYDFAGTPIKIMPTCQIDTLVFYAQILSALGAFSQIQVLLKQKQTLKLHNKLTIKPLWFVPNGEIVNFQQTFLESTLKFAKKCPL